MSDAENLICSEHGKTPVAYMCTHLAGGIACGYHADDDPEQRWPDAWCDLCEETFQAAGEWTDAATEAADIKALCTHCYEDARARNLAVPRLASGGAARLTEVEASRLFHHAVHEAQAVQTASREKWGWGGHARWNYDDNANTLTFSDPVLPRLVADVQFVGSYSAVSRTFQWAWETLDADDPNHPAIARIRVFGEVRGMPKLTTANWACALAEGWEMAALASYLLGSEGIYRAPFDGDRLFWFMLLTNWRVVHPGPTTGAR